MKNLVCNFAPLRFLPYREIGEFVNVGVVVNCPQVDYFGFRVIRTRRTGRLTHFFPELDAQLLRVALKRTETELERVRATHRILPATGIVSPADAQVQIAAFQELVRRREGLLHFGDTGMMVADDPEEALDELFGRYVERQFAQRKEYQETTMRNRLNRFLRQWNLAGEYEKDQKVGDDEFHVVLPFVHRTDATIDRAIKPLDLDKQETSDIYHHGGAWVKNMERLANRSCLPTTTIFTMRMPQEGKKLRAANEICYEFGQIGVRTVSFQQTAALRQLAEIGKVA